VLEAHESDQSVTKESIRLEPKRMKNEQKEVEKLVVPFNIENELAKIKISVPLTKLVKHPAYQR